MWKSELMEWNLLVVVVVAMVVVPNGMAEGENFTFPSVIEVRQLSIKKPTSQVFAF